MLSLLHSSRWVSRTCPPRPPPSRPAFKTLSSRGVSYSSSASVETEPFPGSCGTPAAGPKTAKLRRSTQPSIASNRQMAAAQAAGQHTPRE